jgi:hypothetical protein
MPFGKRIDGPAGRRRVLREDVVLAATVQSLKSTRPVVVVEVSPTGAKLQGRDFTSLDRDVLIRVGGIDLLAQIAWTSRGECGVTFEEALSDEMVELIKRDGRWAHVMGIAA